MLDTRLQNRQRIAANSPDGRLRGVAVAEDLVDVEFRGAPKLNDYTATGLAELVATVLRDVAATRRRDDRKAIEAAGIEIKDGPHWDVRQRRYLAALDEVEARGRSRGDVVKVMILGDHRDYRVRIHPRLLEHPDPATVLMELHSAYGYAVLDLRRRRAELLREHLST